jgi:hypothetical protein
VAPSKRWSAGYYDVNGRRHRKTFAIRADAELWEAEGKAKAAAEKAKKADKNLNRVVVAIQAAAAGDE